VENFSSDPPRFSKASGMIKTADTFTITKLWDARGQEVDPVASILVPIRRATEKYKYSQVALNSHAKKRVTEVVVARAD